MSTIKINKEELRAMIKEAVQRRFAALKEQAQHEQALLEEAASSKGDEAKAKE